MAIAWRIVRKQYVDSAFSGIGAEKYGGRWNSPGRKVVYVADSLALAAMETLVHLPYPLPARFHDKCDFQAFQIEIPDPLIQLFPKDNLPIDWQLEPPSQNTQNIGDRWIREGRSVVLKLASTLVPLEYNYLLNPEHDDFSKLVIREPVSYAFDTRFTTQLSP